MRVSPQKNSFEIWIGLAWLAVAVTLWAGWLVVARASVGAGLTPGDIALLRTGAPALLLAPFWLWPAMQGAPRAAFAPTRWLLLAMLCAWGAPFVMLASAGLAFGDVALSGALTPGAMPLWAVLIGFALFGAKPSRLSLLGLVVILAAAGLSLLAVDGVDWRAAALFSGAAIAWACFAVAFPRSGLTPPQAAGLVGFYSAVGILGAEALFGGVLSLSNQPWRVIVAEFLLHGVLAGAASVLAFAAALNRLGAVAATGAALTPGIAGMMAWAWLGEALSVLDALSLGLAGLGVALTQLGAASASRRAP